LATSNDQPIIGGDHRPFNMKFPKFGDKGSTIEDVPESPSNSLHGGSNDQRWRTKREGNQLIRLHFSRDRGSEIVPVNGHAKTRYDMKIRDFFWMKW
jgi:hypothetical protein